MSYPKLRYPILTKGLSQEERLIVLSYDMIWRLKEAIKENHEKQKFDGPNIDLIISDTEKMDVDANLTNLGHYIEEKICNGDFTIFFEPTKI
jgi:hypothetical protein